MGCLGNSKTEDQRIDEKAQREANKKIEKQLQKERLAYKATHRLLLLGKEEAAEVGAGASRARRGQQPQPAGAAGAAERGDAAWSLGYGKCRLLLYWAMSEASTD